MHDLIAKYSHRVVELEQQISELHRQHAKEIQEWRSRVLDLESQLAAVDREFCRIREDRCCDGLDCL